MLKVLIIICCEVVMGSKGSTSYSYEAAYGDKTDYAVTLYTTQKYNVGDTVIVLDTSTEINWSDTSEFDMPLD
tara:strand:- start:1643 stop:1861 length:219 start_codon:yes stop_codon:yes gene_type:complete